MRYLIPVAALIAPVLPAAADEAPEAAIQSVIRQQIEAFRAGDIATAFGFAAPAIQAMFGSADRFGTMVRGGYPMVWHPADLRFLDLTAVHGALWQMVLVKDEAGVWHRLAYRMEPDGKGGWLIAGVEILRAPETAA
ncbi:MAG: DUF4864 domain-containing protein [Mangrovicoccus sp.]|nr:DUF4864 domain-containing protein [Mangrovicoccus sp.]